MDNYLKLSYAEQDNLLEAQRASGETIRSFCRERGIKESRFYSWRTRRNRQAKKEAAAGFTQLSPLARPCLQIVLAGGLKVNFSADQLTFAADLLLLMDRRRAGL